MRKLTVLWLISLIVALLAGMVVANAASNVKVVDAQARVHYMEAQVVPLLLARTPAAQYVPLMRTVIVEKPVVHEKIVERVVRQNYVDIIERTVYVYTCASAVPTQLVAVPTLKPVVVEEKHEDKSTTPTPTKSTITKTPPAVVETPTPKPTVETPVPTVETPAPTEETCDKANPGNPKCVGNSHAPKFQPEPGLGVKGNSDTHIKKAVDKPNK